MTDKEKLEKVKAEIERRRDRHSKAKRIESALEDNAILSFIDSMQKEPKQCMYSKDNYTAEDRKVLCDGCVEECKFNKKEEPVSDDLEEVSKKYSSCIYLEEVLSDDDKEVLREKLINTFKTGAQWKEQQMMANAVDGFVIEDIEEGNGDFLLSAEYLPKNIGLKDRQKVKVIVIKDN